MLVSPKVMEALKSIGLNLYERRLWVALLARGASTAGELSEIANVPRSRTYDILQSLAEKGFIVVQTSKPIRYVAIPPEEALERAKKKIEEELKLTLGKIDELRESAILRELTDVHTKGLKLINPEEMTGALKGKYSLHQQLATMFKEANEKINIVTTPEGLIELYENHFDILKKAKDRGVKIKIASKIESKSSDVIKDFSSIAEIRNINEKETPIYGRFFVVDGKELVFSLTDSKVVHSTQDLAFWSRSKHAAGDILGPLFDLVWNHSKPIS